MADTATPAPESFRWEPFTASFEGHASSADDWPNTVTILASEAYNEATADASAADDAEWVDLAGSRQLVKIDTNYKPGRPGQHPVYLTRTAAAQLAAAVLQAIEDTFHAARVGRLRPAEAAELLRSLEDVDYALTDLRSHALTDLLRDTGLDPAEH